MSASIPPGAANTAGNDAQPGEVGPRRDNHGLGDRLRALLDTHDVSQRELGAAAGVRHVSDIVNGRRLPRMGSLTSLVGALVAIEPAVGAYADVLAAVMGDGAGVAPDNPKYPDAAESAQRHRLALAEPIDVVISDRVARRRARARGAEQRERRARQRIAQALADAGPDHDAPTRIGEWGGGSGPGCGVDGRP